MSLLTLLVLLFSVSATLAQESDWLEQVEVIESGWCSNEPGAFFSEPALRGLILHLETVEGSSQINCDLRLRLLENDLTLQVDQHRISSERLRVSNELFQDENRVLQSRLESERLSNAELREKAKNRFYLGLVTGTLGASLIWTVFVLAL
jgi:hypothetical protein